ncbi:MAG: hypothetical protein PUI47_03350 [Prevotella copri]|nr:hypothetical protein [Segatella copri]MDY6203749.1 hypothetical protein [Segatella copri]
MADLQRIQNRMDQLSSLIQEVKASQEVADIERLKTALLLWKSETDAVLDLEFSNYTPEVDDFCRRWNRPMVGNSIKNGIIKKLRNVRTDLRLILRFEQPTVKAKPEPELPEYAITDYARVFFNI